MLRAIADADAAGKAGGVTAPAAPAGPPAKRVVIVAVGALPPGGGKTSFFAAFDKAVGDALRARENGGADRDVRRRAAIVSSDAEKENFDSRLAQRLRSVAVVGYDKNVPNCAGVAKLARVAAHAAGAAKVDARVLLVVPTSAPDAETLWARVAARPAGDAALHAHGDGGPGGARAVFERFVGLCEDATDGRAGSPRYPGALATDAFAARDDAEAALARLARTAVARAALRALGDDAVDGDAETDDGGGTVVAAPVAELAAALKSTAGDGENGDEAGGGARLAQHRGSYVGARLLDAPHLHVTLVPPCVASESNGGSADDGPSARGARRCARSAGRGPARQGARREVSRVRRRGGRRLGVWRSARSRASASRAIRSSRRCTT